MSLELLCRKPPPILLCPKDRWEFPSPSAGPFPGPGPPSQQRRPTTCPLLPAGLEWGCTQTPVPAPARARSRRSAVPQVGAQQPPAAPPPPAVPRPLPAAAAAAPWKSARGSSGNWLGGLNQNRASNSSSSDLGWGAGWGGGRHAVTLPQQLQTLPVGGRGNSPGGVKVPFLPVTHASIVSLFLHPHRGPFAAPGLWSVPENFASRDTGTQSPAGSWDWLASASRRLECGASRRQPLLSLREA